MRERIRPRPRPPQALASKSYPLERVGLVAGAVVGSAFGVVFFSPLAGFAVFVLFAFSGFLWRDGEPPVLAFCLAYQWFFVVTGFLYQNVTGEYPGIPYVGNLTGAVALSLFGFLCLAAGIRLAGLLLPPQLRTRIEALRGQSEDYRIRRLFLVVVAVYLMNYLGNLRPTVFFNFAQIIERLLEFRGVLLFALLLTILRKNRGYAWGAAAFLFALVPRLASSQSVFKELFFMLILGLLAYWRPWSADPRQRRRSAAIAVTLIVIVTGLGCMGVLWEGAIKPIWRRAHRMGTVADSPTGRVAEFSGVVAEASGDFQLGESVAALAGRLSSGVGYFSHVLEHVPAVVPHEGGTLTMRAVRHVVTPRFLFPDKGNLGVDSWLVRIYAGMDVAGEELQTSVGLTYMGQFYIDFGRYGMFLALLGYGMLIGLLYRAMILFAPSFSLFCGAVTIIFLGHFTSYEGEIAKDLGGLIQSGVMFTAILVLVGPLLHSYLSGSSPIPGRRRQRRVYRPRPGTIPRWAPPLRPPGPSDRL